MTLHFNFLKCYTFWSYRQWAKTRKKVYFGRTMHCLPQRLKKMNKCSLKFFWVEWCEEKISKNLDFSLWGNPATTQTHYKYLKLEFFPCFSSLCAHCKKVISAGIFFQAKMTSFPSRFHDFLGGRWSFSKQFAMHCSFVLCCCRNFNKWNFN